LPLISRTKTSPNLAAEICLVRERIFSCRQDSQSDNSTDVDE